MQPSSSSLLSISDKIAERLAHSAQFMGLDDEEESLLWQYFAVRGRETPRLVMECLNTQGQSDVYEVGNLAFVASIDKQWHRSSGPFRKNDIDWQVQPFSNGTGIVEGDPEHLIADETEKAKIQAFIDLQDKLRCIKVNDLTVAPSSDDISITITGAPVHLNSLLRNYLGV